MRAELSARLQRKRKRAGMGERHDFDRRHSQHDRAKDCQHNERIAYDAERLARQKDITHNPAAKRRKARKHQRSEQGVVAAIGEDDTGESEGDGA